MNKNWSITRADAGNLHRESLPAVQTEMVKQYWWMGKLHNSRGPAIEGKFGTRAYYWRGVFIPTPLWQKMPTMTAKEIMSMANVELRRCVIERVGLEKFLPAAKLLDSFQAPKMPEPNRLYKVTLPNDPADLVFLRLINTTPEPDGHHKIYYLRVPPEMRTVKGALAWTMDIPPEERWDFVFES